MKNSHTKVSVIMPLCMTIFIDTFAMTLVYPLFAPIFSLDAASGGIFIQGISLHIKNILYGLTMAVYPIFMFFTAPLLGDISDRIGRKKVLLLCLLGSSVGAGLSGLAIVAHSFVWFFISRIIAGCMAGSLPVAQAAIADISDVHDKTINMSLIGFAYTLGVVIGPVIGGFLSNNTIVPWFGFATPFFVTTILSICNAAMLVFTFNNTPIKVGKISDKSPIQIIKPLLMFLQATKNNALHNVIFICFFYIMGWNIYLQFVALYLFQHYNFTATQIGFFVGWVGLVMSITMLAIIRSMVRFFTTKQILYIGIILSLVGVCICMLPGVTMQWISVIPVAIGMGLAYTTITTLFSNAVTEDLQGWIMGVSTSTMAAASGVGGLLLGIIATHAITTFLSIILLWIICFGFALRVNGDRS